MLFGIDTSSAASGKRWGKVDWNKVKTTCPASFVILRGHYGTTPDVFCQREFQRVRDAGLPVGAYLFLRFPKNGARAPHVQEQVESFIATLSSLGYGHNELPPSLDVEFPGGAKATGMSAQALMDEVKHAWRLLHNAGYLPLVYTSARVWKEDLRDPKPEPLGMATSPLWAVRWPFRSGAAMRDAAALERADKKSPVVTPKNWPKNIWIQQYQGDAKGVPGMGSIAVDMNRFFPMTLGETGDRVRWVQQQLQVRSNNVAGMPLDIVPQDGKYNEAMVQLIRTFQIGTGQVPDGIIGPRTFAMLCQ